MTDTTCSTLLGRAKLHDSLAWTQIVELYSPLVAQWCNRKGLDWHDAADVMQEVFRGVARNLSGYNSTATTGGFRAWLWGITQNKLRDYFRSEKSRFPAEGGTDALTRLAAIDSNGADESEPTETHDMRSLTLRALAQIRNEFSDHSWRVFERLVFDGLPTDVVARELSTSATAVRQVRSRILRRLRQHLE